MKTIVLMTLLALPMFGQNLPKIFTLGPQTPQCMQAVYKTLYVEVRVGIPAGHVVYVACNLANYETVLKQYNLSYAVAPYGFSDPKTTSTYLMASIILRQDSVALRHDTRTVITGNFGQFVVAHEIGHLASSSPEEWRADIWAEQNLRKYVKVSYEDFTTRPNK